MMRDTTAALWVALASGTIGAGAALTGLSWGWTAAGLALVQGIAAGVLPRAQRRKLAPLAIGLALVAIVGMAPIVARVL